MRDHIDGHRIQNFKYEICPEKNIQIHKFYFETLNTGWDEK